MKKPISLFACILVCAAVFSFRMTHISLGNNKELKLTDWDCLGYYMYLPGALIYNDISDLKWMPGIESKYHMIGGGDFYQAGKCATGHYVGKYLGGIAIMQAPFFLIAHYAAPHFGYPQDGFSQPYQWAVAIAAIFYALLGVFLLRRFLLNYFRDLDVGISILLLCLATNFLYYVAIDGGLSHAYIFLLYAIVLHTTKKWHDKPTLLWAGLTGLTIGFATICRPTEAIMLFIPLMWGTQSKEAIKQKYALIKQHKTHVIVAIVSGFIGIFPQLWYWKKVSGKWIYEVGSSWDFLSPHVNVLFGWEKGWFIYTPITLFFIVGMFFMKGKAFRESVLWFCILNLYIIVSWRDWRYGGSFSTRALMQSYPVFALPFTAFIQYVGLNRWRWVFYLLGAYLLVVNIFQHDQYHKTILHCNDMNRQYYGRIYLNEHPDALDMSLLDNKDVLNDTKGYSVKTLVAVDTARLVQFKENADGLLFETTLSSSAKDVWIQVDCYIKTSKGFWGAHLNTLLSNNDTLKHNEVRLASPISKEGENNRYTFYAHVPEKLRNSLLKVYISNNGEFDGTVDKISVKELAK